DSPLLQVSSDERSRAARVAEMFAEEDLTRFLQIMLRAHSDISYKAEQRFHLELGLLKLVHAQRLLPLEQVLSGMTSEPVREVSRSSEPTVRLSSTPSKAASAPQNSAVSPFERDRARKTASSSSSPFEGTSSFDGTAGHSATSPVVSSAAVATAVALESPP